MVVAEHTDLVPVGILGGLRLCVSMGLTSSLQLVKIDGVGHLLLLSSRCGSCLLGLVQLVPLAHELALVLEVRLEFAIGSIQDGGIGLELPGLVLI